MTNMVCVIGRLIDKPIKNGENNVLITIAVPRTYKNTNGEIETDLINAQLWDGIATNAEQYLNKGDLVGVKGRLETKDDKMIVIAEKITFLSSKADENNGE